MTDWKSVDAILDFAIENEENAAKFYRELATMAKLQHMKQVFEGYACEEDGHKAKLVHVKAGGQLAPAKIKVMDLKIGDYLVDQKPTPDLDYQGSLILAMKMEKAAFKLYTDLAEATDDPQVRDLLLSLAQEEARHKLRFEIEYDDNIYVEN